MTYFNQHWLPFFAMATGLVIMLVLPTWVNYVLLVTLITMALGYAYSNYPNEIKLLFQFFTEFIGFCFMLSLFLSCIIGMNIFFA